MTALRDPIAFALLTGTMGGIAFLLKKNAFFVDVDQLALVYSPVAGLQQTVFHPGWHMSLRWFRGEEIIYYSTTTHAYALPKIDVYAEMPAKKTPELSGEAPVLTYGREDTPIFKIITKVSRQEEDGSSTTTSTSADRKYLGSLALKVNFRPDDKKANELYRTYGSEEMYPDRTIPPLMETCVGNALTDLLGRPPVSTSNGDDTSFSRVEYDLNLTKDLHSSFGQFYGMSQQQVSSSEAKTASRLLQDYMNREQKLVEYYDAAAKVATGERSKPPVPPAPLSSAMVEKVATTNFQLMKKRFEEDFVAKDMKERFIREELMGKCNMVSKKGKTPFYLDVRQVHVEDIK